MPLNFEVYDPTNNHHAAHAEQISAWSKGEHMLPLTPQRMGEHVLGLLAYEDATLVGYRAVTQQYGETTFEVGAMVVDSAQRGKGYGTEIAAGLVEVAQTTFPDATLIAFCNERSVGISKRLGFEPVQDINEVPAAALELCTTCPMFDLRKMGQICCDTIVALRPTNQLPAPQ